MKPENFIGVAVPDFRHYNNLSAATKETVHINFNFLLQVHQILKQQVSYQAFFYSALSCNLPWCFRINVFVIMNNVTCHILKFQQIQTSTNFGTVEADHKIEDIFILQNLNWNIGWIQNRLSLTILKTIYLNSLTLNNPHTGLTKDFYLNTQNYSNYYYVKHYKLTVNSFDFAIF